jgi:hypothetical protein
MCPYGEASEMFTTLRIVMPTAGEHAAIDRGIATDPDTYELGADEMKKTRCRGTLIPHARGLACEVLRMLFSRNPIAPRGR